MATKVKIVGFEMQMAKNLTFFDLFQAARSNSGKEVKVNGKITYSLCDRVDNYMAGMVLYYKGDRKSITTSKDDKGNLLVQKSTLRDGQHSTEASLFCVNPKNLKGVLYQYVGAISSTGFYRLLKQSHDKVVKQKVDDKVNEITNFGYNKVSVKKARAQARKMYSGKFKLNILLKELDINEIVKQLDRVDKIQIKAISALDKAPFFKPLDPWANSADITVGLHTPKSKDSLVQSIKQVVAAVPISSKGKAVKLAGKNFSGEDAWFWVGDNLTHYGIIEYDEYVDHLPSALWADYPGSKAMTKLKAVLRDNQPVFGYLPLARDWPIEIVKETESEDKFSTV